jgi:hypothetical protein
MPFKYVSDLAKDDQLVKLVFDHLRNLGICAVVLVAANWTHQQNIEGVQYYIKEISSWMLYAASFFLFFFNMEFAFHKLSSLQVPKFIRFFIVYIYLTCIFRIFLYLISSH